VRARKALDFPKIGLGGIQVARSESLFGAREETVDAGILHPGKLPACRNAVQFLFLASFVAHDPFALRVRP
jgi:hypothetical protein